MYLTGGTFKYFLEGQGKILPSSTWMEMLSVFLGQQARPVPDPKSRHVPIMDNVKRVANSGAQRSHTAD